MEAAKLKKKRGTINKGKVKKTIKNVICRPDPVFWPAVTDAEGNLLSSVLIKHRVPIPDFKKPHWNELKLIPKNGRPKPQTLKKVYGLLFGISVCKNAIENSKCSGVIIEASVEPQIIAQSIIEACTSSDIPVICLKDLRTLTKNNFGIQTSCLGIEKDCLMDISNHVKEIYQSYKHKFKQLPENNLANDDVQKEEVIQTEDSEMDIEKDPSYKPYLYRSDKKTRVFVPSNKPTNGQNNRFVGQNFIQLSAKSENKTDNKNYMRMILKKISSNPNRVKVK